MSQPVTFGAAGKVLALSVAYCWMPRLICRKLFMQFVRRAAAFARDKAGNNNAARMAMIAITTNSSIKVNAKSKRWPAGGIWERSKGLGSAAKAVFVFIQCCELTTLVIRQRAGKGYSEWST